MKKSLVSVMVGLLMLEVSGNVWAESSGGGLSLGHTAEDVQCNGCVNDSDIADGAVTESKLANGAVTNSKLADWSVSGSKIVDFSITDTKISSNAVTTAKIADGSVNDAKIIGPISGSKLGNRTHDGADIINGTVATSKISDGAVTDAKITGPISASKLEKLANVIVVAKSGGNFDSIQAAIDSISPTADNPYLIKVMPGIYVESITMKSYIHLQGAGRDVTTISAPNGTYSSYVIYADNCTNISISGFTTRGGGGYNVGGAGIISSSSATIIYNTITGVGIGMQIGGAQETIISGNIITANYVSGIKMFSAPNVTISGNIITNNGDIGIWNFVDSSPTIIYNKIKGHSYGDIYFGWTGESACNGMPLISFNVYDTIKTGCGVGTYNVKSDGSPAPAP